MNALDHQSLERELARLRRGQALLRIVLALCWSPAIIVALLLAIGFHAYAPNTAGPPAWVDALLNYFALGMFVSLVLVPVAIAAALHIATRLDRRARATLPSLEPADHPIRPGEVLGRWVVRRCDEESVVVRRTVFPGLFALVINSALAASVWMMVDLVVRGHPPHPVGAFLGSAIVFFMMLGVYGLANTDQTLRRRTLADGLEFRFVSRRVPPVRWRTIVIRMGEAVPLLVGCDAGGLALRAGETVIEIDGLGMGPLGKWNSERLARAMAPGIELVASVASGSEEEHSEEEEFG